MPWLFLTLLHISQAPLLGPLLSEILEWPRAIPVGLSLQLLIILSYLVHGFTTHMLFGLRHSWPVLTSFLISKLRYCIQLPIRRSTCMSSKHLRFNMSQTWLLIAILSLKYSPFVLLSSVSDFTSLKWRERTTTFLVLSFTHLYSNTLRSLLGFTLWLYILTPSLIFYVLTITLMSSHHYLLLILL